MDWSSPGPVLLVILLVVLVALFATAVVLLVRLLRMVSVVRSEAMPVQGKVAFWAALAYTVFPVDVLLDPVYLDDIGVLAGAIAYLSHLARKHGITGGGVADDAGGPADGAGRGRAVPGAGQDEVDPAAVTP